MEFDGEGIKFNLFEAMKYPSGHDDKLESSLEPIHCNKEWGDGLSRAEDDKPSAEWEATHH